MRERVRGIRIALFFYCFLYEVCVLYAAILRVGNPLRWIQSKPHLQSVRLAGVRQFISHYQRCQSLELPHFYWGDEIEYGVFTRNTPNRHFDLSLSSTKIREFLSKQEKQYSDLPIGCEWQPEYGAWMVEAVPKNPYGSYVSDLCNVEKSMQLRRKRLHQALQPDEIAPTISSFPMLGVDGYEHCEPREGEIANSRYISDRIINPHPRFGALTRNIRMRRGSNVNILVPKDTSLSSLTELSEKREVGGEGEGKEKNIHMDAMAFGMGCCCLQVTMQCRSEVESRYLNDQLAILAPILQALSASTPIFRGQLADTDTRWNVIGGAVDDRTPAERGEITDPVKIKEAEQEELVGKGVRRLSKSRYSTISLFIGKPSSEEELKNIQALNDLPIDFNPEVLTMMSQSGVDDVLSLHIAHLFTRDPLVIFDDAIDLNDSQTLDHFENIQSTNWRSMRWKLPSLRIGKEYEKRREEKIASLITLRRENGGEDEIDFDHNILFEDRFDCIQDNSNSNNNNSNNIQSESPSETLVDDPALLSLPSFPISSSSASSELSELQSFGPGWRIEFRPLEVQLTDYENAAFAIFTVLLSRCIASQGHNFYLPMSYVEENMRRAQVKDAVRTERFFIRRNSIKSSTLPPSAASEALKTTPCASSISESDCECIDCPPPASMIPAIPTVPSRKYDIPSLREIDIAELTMDEIFNGEKDLNRLDRFKGFIPMLLEYINSLGCDDRLYVTKELLPYFTLLSDKAKADLPTTAQWMREKILHPPSPLSETPLFTKEGVLNPQRVDYLLRLCEDIGMGRIQCPELYGYRQSTPVKEMKKILSDPMTNHLSLLNMTMIANLDKIDEEDLMFTNFSCFIKPVSFQSTSTISLTRDGVEQEDRILLDDVRGSRGALDSRNISIMSLSVEESEVEDSKSVVKEDEVREERERRSSSPSPFRRIRNFVSNLFERKKRNREESIRF